MLDDREPEPGTARRARTVASVEALEEAGKLLLLETAPVVGRLEDARPRAKRQRRSRPGVANRVLGEVLGHDLEHATPKGQLDRRIGIEQDANVRVLRAVGQPVAYLLEHRQNGRRPA